MDIDQSVTWRDLEARLATTTNPRHRQMLQVVIELRPDVPLQASQQSGESSAAADGYYFERLINRAGKFSDSRFKHRSNWPGWGRSRFLEWHLDGQTPYSSPFEILIQLEFTLSNSGCTLSQKGKTLR